MKRASLFIVLGAAFVAVSLWYLLSAGRSKRATRLKYRLGGALLSIMAITSTGCGITSCYDPALPESEYEEPSYNIDFVDQDIELPLTMSNGDKLMFKYETNTSSLPKFVVIVPGIGNIQESMGEGEGNIKEFTLDVSDFVGDALLFAYWVVESDSIERNPQCLCGLNIVAKEEN
jgi:hypothetical protein